MTEVVYRLGVGDRLVGADTSSTYSEAATRLPQVSYQRMLLAEGVLSLKPSLILASAEAGPPEAVTLLQGAGTPIVMVPIEPTLVGAQRKIRVIAAVTGYTGFKSLTPEAVITAAPDILLIPNLSSPSGAHWSKVWPTLICTLPAVRVLCHWFAHPLNVLLLGEAEATHLGIPIEWGKRGVVGLVALLNGWSQRRGGGAD